MCGIVGFIGQGNTKDILLNGIYRLEYRGYDSAGVSILDENKIHTIKSVGQVKNLDKKVSKFDIEGSLGIAHTRWATHGKVTEKNAHPHISYNKKIALVHNGIIENYLELKEKLIQKGYKFYSDTDSEIIANLIEYKLDKYNDLFKSVIYALKEVRGTYGLAVISPLYDEIIIAKNGSPLLVGIHDNFHIIASDISAIIEKTNKIIYLKDKEIAKITKDSIKISNIWQMNDISPKISKVDVSNFDMDKKGFDTYMLKEISEQSQVVFDTMRGRIDFESNIPKLGGIANVEKQILNAKKIIFTACGTAYHAGLVGQYLLNELTNLDVETKIASEFRYENKNYNNKDTIVFAISQSGETADTLATIKDLNLKNFLTLGIINVVGSSIAREVKAGVYTHAGCEIGVASTKAFITQITVLYLLAIYIARMKDMSEIQANKLLKELNNIPNKIEKIIARKKEIEKIAEKYVKYKNFLYLGKRLQYPIALEGALKLKELSYIHAEGYASGEMKHGPLAMIDKKFPCLFLIPKDNMYDKVFSNLQEIKARFGRVFAIATKGDEKIKNYADDVFYINKTEDIFYPLLTAIPLQLFAYFVAKKLGKNVDKPRNLAKSVTVE